MAIFKCKMCNANLSIEPGVKMVTCEFCGATQMIEKRYPGENNVKHGFILLAEGQFRNAKEYFDKALDENAEASEAYIGKLLVKNEIKSKEEFFSLADKGSAEDLLMTIKNSLDYKSAIRFAEDEDKEKYESFKNELYKKTYDKAVVCMEQEDYTAAIELLKMAYEYGYSKELLEKCEGLLASANNEAEYQKALSYMNNEAYKNAISIFRNLKGYKDSEELLKKCKYKNGEANMKAQEYMDAISVFEEITGYMDSQQLMEICENIVFERRYQYAKELLEKSNNIENVKNAKEVFLDMPEYKDSEKLAGICDNEMIYLKAKALMDKAIMPEQWKASRVEFEKILGYKNSKELAKKCKLFSCISTVLGGLIFVVVLVLVIMILLSLNK